MGYIEKCDRPALEAIYTEPCNVCIVLRCMDEIGQCIVTRLTFIDAPIDIADVMKWVNFEGDLAKHNLSVDSRITPAQRAHDHSAAGQIAHSLHGRQRHSAHEGVQIVHATRVRRRTCQNERIDGLSRSTTSCTHLHQDAIAVGHKIESKSRRTRAQLQTYALERWEAVLQFLALCNETTQAAVSEAVRDVLCSARLIRPSKSHHDSPYDITSAGFHFLLLDRKRQLSAFLVALLDYCVEKTQAHRVRLVTILCRILLAPSVEVPYVKCAMSQDDQACANFVHILREVGLLHLPRTLCRSAW